MDFTFHKNYRLTNDTYLFDGCRYRYKGDLENIDKQIIAKVYEYGGYAIIAVIDGVCLTFNEITDMMQAVEDETGFEVSDQVWEADKKATIERNITTVRHASNQCPERRIPLWK